MIFPGMMEDPGEREGRVISPNPALGPELIILRSFAIFEIESLDAAMLDKIVNDLYNNLHNINAGAAVPTSPVETANGIYYLDLIKLQNAHPDISSKKALRAFIDNSPFIRLDLVCSHIPAWLKSPEYEKKLDIGIIFKEHDILIEDLCFTIDY